MLCGLYYGKRFYFGQLNAFIFYQLHEQGYFLLFTTRKWWKRSKALVWFLLLLYAPFFKLEPRVFVLFPITGTRVHFFKFGLITTFELIIILTDSFVLLAASINREEAKDKNSRCKLYSFIIPCRQTLIRNSLPLGHNSPWFSRENALRMHLDLLLDNGDFFPTPSMCIPFQYKRTLR